jgi:hypothetical protein
LQFSSNADLPPLKIGVIVRDGGGGRRVKRLRTVERVRIVGNFFQKYYTQ